MRVAIIMGSTSDLPKLEPAIDILKDYGVAVDVRCLSAHRAHAGLSAFIEEANSNGTEVIIAGAGMAAALPGVVASQTVLPVIGVPISGSVLDGVETLDETTALIQGKGGPLLAYGSALAKMGNVFEEKVADVLNDNQNFLKWKEESKLVDGYYYPLFLQIVNKFHLNKDEVTHITATTKVPPLKTRGKAKTDVIVEIEINSKDKVIFTISCKRSEKTIVSVHEYSAERYAMVLNPEDEELEELLKEFSNAGGINAYTKNAELTDKMRVYGDALARWGVGGYGDPKVTQPELQCANYVLTLDAKERKYSIHELDEYINLCKLDEKNGGHFGTIFRWTKKKDNIQLKMKLL